MAEKDIVEVGGLRQMQLPTAPDKDATSGTDTQRQEVE